jgi:cytidylate kinase
MEGRDITTHVFPDADFKIYLDASLSERAERRYRQLKAAGANVNRRKLRESILMRDLNDLKRKINPLMCPPDAIVIDSTRLTLHQVANRFLRAIEKGEASLNGNSKQRHGTRRTRR